MISVKAVLITSLLFGFVFTLFYSARFAQARRISAPTGSNIKFCTKEYMPVCGTNNVTYGNSCEAKVASVAVACNGACPCGDGDRYENPLPVVNE